MAALPTGVNDLAELAELLRTAGVGVVAEILIEGRIFHGREAYEKGLLSRVVPDEAVEAEAQAQAICMATGDFRRAFEAFAAKRKPVFEGN